MTDCLAGLAVTLLKTTHLCMSLYVDFASDFYPADLTNYLEQSVCLVG